MAVGIDDIWAALVNIYAISGFARQDQIPKNTDKTVLLHYFKSSNTIETPSNN